MGLYYNVNCTEKTLQQVKEDWLSIKVNINCKGIEKVIAP